MKGTMEFYTKTAMAVCAMLLWSLHAIGQNGYEININIQDYTNDTIIVGNYYGERQVVKDTLYKKAPGKFVFAGKESLPPGMYLVLLKPENNFIQFLVSDREQRFNIDINPKNLSKVGFSGSADNALFYQYIDFIKGCRDESDFLKSEKAVCEENKDCIARIDAKVDSIDRAVKQYQKDLVGNNRNTITASIVYANLDIDIPEFEGASGDSLQRLKYYYFKKHYFDHVSFSDKMLIRSPFIHSKLDYYITKLTPQTPDSITVSLDHILSKLKPNEEAFKYYLSWYLNHYAKSKFIGMDAMYVHLVDNYYSKGMAPWVSEESMEKIMKTADDLRPLLIGKICPNITTYTQDDKPVVLHNVKSPYTILLFWANDCGHCQKSMPDVVNFYKKFKDKGVTLITICSKNGDKISTCWDGVKEKKMEDFINTADQYARWRRLMAVNTTPKIFILDSKKEILLKDIPAEKLEEVMLEVMKVDGAVSATK